jgi:hypothetical protein
MTAVGTNAGRVYLGDPRHDPLYAGLHRRCAMVFVHPTSPPCAEAISLGRPRPMLEFIFDTARTVSDLVFSGVLTRYPDIEWVFTPAEGRSRCSPTGWNCSGLRHYSAPAAVNSSTASAQARRARCGSPRKGHAQAWARARRRRRVSGEAALSSASSSSPIPRAREQPALRRRCGRRLVDRLPAVPVGIHRACRARTGARPGTADQAAAARR